MQKAKYTVTSVQMLDQVYRDARQGIEDFGFIKLEWKAGSNRSINQNDLYYKWLGELAVQTTKKSNSEWTKDELHRWLKAEFLGYKETTVGKKQITELVSTASLLKGDMYYYMQQVEAFAYTHGFTLTIPDDSEYIKLKMKENL